jgi:hypothetical protein
MTTATETMKAKRNGRRSQFLRAQNASPLVPQPRDVLVLKILYEYGLLAGDEIERLAGFGCATRRNGRLRALFDHGYVDRKFLPTLRGNAKVLYFLGAKGSAAVAEVLGEDPDQVRRQARQVRETKDIFLLHRLQLNQVRLAISAAANRVRGIELKLWKSEPELTNVQLIPDGYCRYEYKNLLWSVFLELDRSTESHRRIQAKVEQYLHFGLSGLYQRHFGLKFFRALIITLNEKRLGNLKQLIERTTDKLFWLTTLDEVTSRKLFFDRIWRRPGKDELFALHEE